MTSKAKYWCAAQGCNSDDRKRGKYAFMNDVEFFPFPSQSKTPKLRKKWLELMRRENYDPKPKHRLCSRHFVDGKPTSSHPYPELFAYNNYKESTVFRSMAAIVKRSQPVAVPASQPAEFDTMEPCFDSIVETVSILHNKIYQKPTDKF